MALPGYSLDPFQEVGARWLAGQETGLLGDEPGIGKTPQLITACNLVEGVRKVGVLVPASGVANWYREVERWGSGLWDVEVRSYNQAEKLTPDYDTLICDEAHYLKESMSGRTMLVYGTDIKRSSGMIGRAKRVWLATGTPMPNHNGELWTHLHALAPHLIPRKGHDSAIPESMWQRKFCLTQPGRFGTRKVVGSKDNAQVRDLLAPFMLRRLKKDVFKDMPPIRFADLALDAEIDETLFADEVEVLKDAIEESWDAVVALDPEIATLRRLTALAKVPSTIIWLKEWLASHPGEKIVVFALHTQVLKALKKAFPDSVGIDGSTLDRQKPVDKFQAEDGPRVFFGQMVAAGTVITLTRAHTAFFLESDWVPSNVTQAAQRIHRRGTEHPCLIYMGYIPGSIDELVTRTVARKAADIMEVIG